MNDYKNSSLLTVLLADRATNRLLLAQWAARQNTASNPLLADIEIDDDAMHAMGINILSLDTKFTATPRQITKALVNSGVFTFCTGYNKNATFIQGKARDLVITTGDVNQGINLIENSGYFFKGTKSPIKLGFDLQNEGTGTVSITTKSVATGAGYIRQYGLTSAKGIPPDITYEMLFSMEVDIILTGIKSGTILAFREAAILPISRKAASGTSSTMVEKIATPSVIGKAHHRIFTFGQASNYNWGPWIYIIVS